MVRCYACACDGRRVHWPAFSVSHGPASGREVPMSTPHARQFSRRRFLGGLTFTGTAGLLGLHPRLVAAEPPPETTRIRVVHGPAVCEAPSLVAEELLRGEGFTEVQYVMKLGGTPYYKVVASGEGDILLSFAASILPRMDVDDPLLFLAGVHVGCLEVFGTQRISSIRDLKGKTWRWWNSARPSTSSWPPCWRTWGSTPRVRSIGSSVHTPSRGGCSPRSRSTPFSRSPRLPRRCARRTLAT